MLTKRLYLVCMVLAVMAANGWKQPPAVYAGDSSRKLVFFDLWKLDYWDNVELAQGKPKWLHEASYTDPGRPPRGIYFPSVLPRQSNGKWRMVYSTRWSPFQLMAAESSDGLHWKPLAVDDVAPAGGKLAPHHVFTLANGEGSGVYVDPQNSDGYRYRIFARQHGDPVRERALADPEHRWHTIARSEGEKPYFSEAVTLVSKDGLHWHLRTGGHWNWGQDGWFPEPPIFAFWNDQRQQHVMTVRPGWGDRRQCLRTSTDMRSWSDPELLLQPDALDTAGPIGIYAFPVFPLRGAGYVGLVWIFHNSSSNRVQSFNQFYGTMDAQLAFSYDGVRFYRGLRDPFLPRNPRPEFGCSQIRPCSIVETDSEVRIYSAGHRAEHGREPRAQRQSDEPLSAVILHTLRKDGWMFLRCRGDWARFQTKPFALFKPSIRANVDTRYGEMHFQLTDEKSEPLEGFAFDDCVPIRGVDTLDEELTWRGADLRSVLNKVLRLEVRFRNTNIYAFTMDHHFLDAMDHWLLKDDKPIDRRLFDY